jgi:hypothetical protein
MISPCQDKIQCKRALLSRLTGDPLIEINGSFKRPIRGDLLQERTESWDILEEN